MAVTAEATCNYDAGWPYLQFRQHRGPHLLITVVSRQHQSLTYQTDTPFKKNYQTAFRELLQLMVCYFMVPLCRFGV